MEKFIKIYKQKYKMGEYANLYTDGACRGNGKTGSLAGAGAVLYDQDGNILKELRKFLGEGLTNNIAEYKALIMGINEAINMNIKILNVYIDSKLVCEQVRGNYKINKPHLKTLCDNVRQLIKLFDKIKIEYIPRAQNTVADRLANEAINRIKY